MQNTHTNTHTTYTHKQIKWQRVTLEGHKGRVLFCSKGPKELLVTGGQDQTVQFWKVFDSNKNKNKNINANYNTHCNHFNTLHSKQRIR